MVKNKNLLIDERYKNFPLQENGTVDWKALIDKKDIVPNRSYFEKRNKPVPSEVDDSFDDKAKLVLLSGYRRLALLRGYKSVRYIPLGESDDNGISLSCEITWIGDKESNYEDIVFASTANASVRNTDPDFSKFLTSLAENRAFVRAVRNFLNIPIMGQDEPAPEEKNKKILSSNDNLSGPQAALFSKLSSLNKTFDQLKKWLIKSYLKDLEVNESDVMSWNTEKDMPTPIIIKVLGYLEKKN